MSARKTGTHVHQLPSLNGGGGVRGNLIMCLDARGDCFMTSIVMLSAVSVVQL